MRPLPLAICLAGSVVAVAGAQAPASQGSLFLLLPTGAQAVGMGQAMVAEKPGSEGIWWNPASIAAQKQKELAIHHSKTVAGVGDALSFLMPAYWFGTMAFSLNILNLGVVEATDDFQNVVGVILPRDVVFAGSYAKNLTSSLSTGINYKLVQLRQDCSGECGSAAPEVESLRAVDLGAQYDVGTGTPLTFGIAVRNLGGRLNSQETNRHDPLPTQVEAGAEYRLKLMADSVKDTQLKVAASWVNSRALGGKSVRIGTDLVYRGNVHLRAGYVGHDRRGDTSASLGFGLRSGAFAFDIARTFGGLPADNGQAPVYASLRYLF